MLQQPVAHFFLRKGDWVELFFEEYCLYSSGFKTSEVDMRIKEHPLNCIFVLESANPENKDSKGFLQFNQPFFLRHYLSGRYLSYNQHFATKSQIFLKNLLNENCQFIVKPLYKCQVLKHNNLKNGQQCSLTPGSALYSNQKVGLVVSKEKGNSQYLNIALKKNEQSPLRFIRRSQPQQKGVGLYSLQMYQLKHNEVKSYVNSYKKQSKSEVSLTSQKNSQTSYLLIQKRDQENRDQILISQQCEVLLRFYSSKKYFGFGQNGYIFMTEQLNAGCFFRLERYTDEALQPGSPIKIMHIQSGKYLSIRDNQLQLQRFSPFNTWQFVTVSQEQLVDSLFLSDTFEGLSQILSSFDSISSNRRKIRSILKQSINFCYRNSKIYEQFQKLEKVNTVLKPEKQLLFSRIGYLPLIYKLCTKIVEEVRQDKKMLIDNNDRTNKDPKESKELYSDKEELFTEALLLICAICQDNEVNLRLFCDDIKSFFEFIGVVKGPFELLFQLFGFNFIALDILESIQFSSKKTTLKGVQVLLEYLSTKEFAVSERIKVVRLLRSLLRGEQGNKILTHQQILLQSVQQKKLSKILLSLTITNSDQLLIKVNKKQTVELVELLSSNQYQQQAQLLSEQLRLMVGLCRTGSKKHIQLFRQVVSEEMIKKYLKQDLQAGFLAIFMEILIEIYLSQPSNQKNHSLFVLTRSTVCGQQTIKAEVSFSSLKSKLLQHQFELQEATLDKTPFLIDLDSLKKIKTLILSQLSKDLQSKHLEQDVIVYLLALRKFVELQICNENELKSILKMLTKAVQICLDSGVEINKKFTMEYLCLVEYDLDKSLQKAAKNLLHRIKFNYNSRLLRGQYSKEIIKTTNQFIVDTVALLAVGQIANTLQLIIVECLTPQKSQLFLKAAHLYERMINIGVNFIDKIKKSIPIQSDHSFELYEKANSLLAKLTKAVSEALYGRDNTEQLSGKRTMLNVLQEVCEILKSGNDVEGEINILGQKIISQLCFLQRVTDYLSQKKEDLRNPQNNALFAKMFQFISLLLSSSDQIYELNQDSLVKLKLIFKYIDRGQIRLLYQLTKSSIAIKRKYSFLFESWVAAVKSCYLPRIQVPLGLTLLVESWSRAEQKTKYATELAHVIFNEQEFLCNLLKIQSAGEYLSFQVVKRCEYREEWVFYILLVVRLLRLLLQSTSDANQQLKQVLASHISLRMLLNLLQQSFKLQITQAKSSVILALLLKQSRRQLMLFVLQLYLQNLKEQDMELILTYLHKIAAFLSPKYIQQTNNDTIVKMLLYQHTTSRHRQQETSLNEMLVRYIGLQHPGQSINADLINTINNPVYLFINHYYHFCFTLYDAIKIQYSQNQNHTQFNDSPLKQQSFTKQLQLFIQKFVIQYKEVINQKLSYSEFASSSAVYASSIKTAEQITKQSMGLKYKVIEIEDEPLLLEGQQFFEHKELKFLLDRFLGQTHDKLERYLYEAILILLHNRKIELSVNYRVPRLAHRANQIIKFIIAKLRDAKSDDQTFLAYCWVLNVFLKSSEEGREWQPHLEFDEVMVRLSRAKEDRSNRMLGVWLQAEYKLMESYFAGKPTLEDRYRKKKMGEGDGFQTHFASVKDRLKALLQQQRELYEGKRLLEQATTYFQQRRLNNSLTLYKLSTQLLLQWLQLKLRYHHDNTDRYFDLLVQVVLLLKTYTRFLADFDRKYVSQELETKLLMCLRVIFYAVTGGSMRVQMMLLEYELWDDINLILQLDDSLARQLAEQTATTYELIKMLTRDKFAHLPASYMQGVLQIYNNSVAVYGEQEQAIMAVAYPLVPIRPYFQSLKTHAIAILQEFRHCRSAAIQLFSKLDLRAVQANLRNAYEKYAYLFQKYTIAVVYPEVQYEESSKLVIARNMGFQNAVILMGLKLQIDQLNGKTELAQKYAKIRQSLSKQNIQSYLSLFIHFFTDLALLLFGSCIRWSKRRTTRQLSNDEICAFFLSRVGRVQVEWGGRLYNYEFMLYPECSLDWQVRQECLRQLNFASNQLKRESITTAMNIFILQYQNQLSFRTGLWKIGAVLFLAQYRRIFRLLSFCLVVVLNLLLLTDAVTNFNFDGYQLGYPFAILTFIDVLVVVGMLTVELVRKIPLAVKLNRYNLEQGLGFLSRGYNSMSQLQQNCIVFLKILLQFKIIYRLGYTTVTCLTLYNKLFASILLLDCLFRISAIQSLILAIWKPRYKVLLVAIAFIVLQYFFSILLYFFFNGDVNGHCDTLGHCFSFVFSTSFRAINGFVGYLFQEDNTQQKVIQISMFGVFQDIYAIVVHLIMVAVMLAVIINSFVMAKAEDSKQKEALSAACIICNIDRSRFNLENRSSFKTHKTIRHHLFNYFDFKYRLNKKTHLLSDLECWVQQCKGLDWVPDNRAKELEGEADLKRESR